MEFTSSKKGTSRVLHIQGSNFTIEEKDLLNKEISQLVSQTDRLAIDLTDLDYANSQLLGQLLVAFKAMEKKNGLFAIVGAHGSVRDLFRITAMNKIFALFEDLESFEKFL